MLAGFCAVLTALLMFWRRHSRRLSVRGLAWLSLGATVILAGLTVVYRLQPKPEDRAIERMYGGGRGELELGACEVSVPKDHQVGELESPSVLRLEFREDPERHVVLLGVHPEPAAEFYANLQACIAKSTGKEALVFIHGYNMGFETAVRRTAQIAYDLKFDGAPIVYSWPSQEGLLSYTVDETNVAWTVPHLKDFLLGVARQSGAKSVHLIAHSMGNRALTDGAPRTGDGTEGRLSAVPRGRAHRPGHRRRRVSPRPCPGHRRHGRPRYLVRLVQRRGA